MTLQKSFATDGGKLYLVPTPIGNLEDITLRAKNILAIADYIAAEDTRTTGKLLELLGIDSGAKLISFHEHNAKQKSAEIVDKILAGAIVAQVSDAGTPVISDPGYELVKLAVENDVDVISLPGASAFLTAIVGSGFLITPFTYYGFLERKKSDQINFFEQIKDNQTVSVFYESPYRIQKTIENLTDVFEPTRKIVLARELTKLHEEYFRGTLSELYEFLKNNELKGEMVVVVDRFTPAAKTTDFDNLIEQVDDLVKTGLSKKDAIKQVSRENDINKNELYERYHQN